MADSRLPAPQEQLARTVRDFLAALRCCWNVARRARGPVEHSLSLYAIEETAQTAFAIQRLASAAVPGPLRRELRHLLESAICRLYVDQRQRAAPLAQRRALLARLTPGEALGLLHGLELPAFRDDVRREFLAEVHGLHAALSHTEAPTRAQIEMRLEQLERGAYPGAAAARDVLSLETRAFATFEIVLVLALHALGMRLAGEAFVGGFDLQPGWVFHRSRFLDRFSEYYDYRPERRAAL